MASILSRTQCVKCGDFTRNTVEPRISLPPDAEALTVSLHVWAMAWHGVNTLRPGQDGRHFADDIFTCIFINENCCSLIKFSLKYVRKYPIDNNPALVQIMAWRRSGDKPLSEPMMVNLSTHICVTRPEWGKCHVLDLDDIKYQPGSGYEL